MKRTILNSVPLILSLIALIILWKTFEMPHQEYYNGEKHYPFSKGNAPEEIRNTISNQLEKFEKGYIERNVEKLDEFCSELISKDNIHILGTMSYEILYDYEGARDLIESDWLYWGDVYFLMEEANISVYNSVAWISTIGYVEFDMSRFLVVPLRFSGVMVNEDSTWKFQQIQFQFDLNNMQILITIIFLSFISIAFFVRFLFVLIKQLRSKEQP